MKKTIRLTESDLNRLVKRVINEQETQQNMKECTKEQSKKFMTYLTKSDFTQSMKIENAPDGNGAWLKMTEPTGLACAVKKIDFFGSGL